MNMVTKEEAITWLEKFGYFRKYPHPIDCLYMERENNGGVFRLQVVSGMVSEIDMEALIIKDFCEYLGQIHEELKEG